MTWNVLSHTLYLALTVPLTLWVGRELARNGRVFLADVFSGDARLAAAVNKLLVVGFYLVELGFVLLYVRVGEARSAEEVVEVVSLKVGVVMLLLGALHLANVRVFHQLRRRRQAEATRTSPYDALADPADPAYVAPAGPAAPLPGEEPVVRPARPH